MGIEEKWPHLQTPHTSLRNYVTTSFLALMCICLISPSKYYCVTVGQNESNLTCSVRAFLWFSRLNTRVVYFNITWWNNSQIFPLHLTAFLEFQLTEIWEMRLEDKIILQSDISYFTFAFWNSLSVTSKI